ncbi:MAG: hypothetical protein IPN63_01890 [Gammaproteobacteria bacterium]|nr:hypothetical protein [Gammaproteobacteria bacterium]
MIEDFVEIYVGALRFALDDSTWQRLGYPKRPICGELFLRFRPRWKNELESRIMHELIVLFVAMHVAADVCQLEDADDITASEQGVLSLDGWYKNLDYVSETEAVSHLQQSVPKYLAATRDRWPQILVDQFDVTAIPDKKLKERITMGALMLGAEFQALPERLKSLYGGT